MSMAAPELPASFSLWPEGQPQPPAPHTNGGASTVKATSWISPTKKVPPRRPAQPAAAPSPPQDAPEPAPPPPPVVVVQEEPPADSSSSDEEEKEQTREEIGAELAAVVAAMGEDPGATPAAKRRVKPPSTAIRVGTHHRAAVLSAQCSNPPTAQLSRVTDAVRDDEKAEYRTAVYEMCAIDVAATGGDVEESFRQASRACNMFTIASGTGELCRAINDVTMESYLGPTASYNRFTDSNAHNGAQDFFIAEKELDGIERHRYTPLEQNMLRRLRDLEAEMSGVGRRKAFDLNGQRQKENEARESDDDEEKERKRLERKRLAAIANEQNQREKARIFGLQEEVLSGAFGARLAKETAEPLVKAFVEEALDKAAIGDATVDFLSFVMSADDTTVYNLAQQAAVESETCAHRLRNERLQEQRRVAEGKPPLPEPSASVTKGGSAAKRRRARDGTEDIYVVGEFTVTPAPPQKRSSGGGKKKKQQPSEENVGGDDTAAAAASTVAAVDVPMADNTDLLVNGAQDAIDEAIRKAEKKEKKKQKKAAKAGEKKPRKAKAFDE